jgi:hypothetical protein
MPDKRKISSQQKGKNENNNSPFKGEEARGAILISLILSFKIY